MQSAPLPTRNAPALPYFSSIPKSTYCPPAIRGSSSGYSGYQDQTSGQHSTILKGYFECRDLGHMKKFYPRLWGKAEQQDYRPMLTVPATTLPARPARGKGHVARGRPRCGGQSGHALARLYAIPTRPDAITSGAVITSTIFICWRDALVLFDPGSTYSYVSSLFAPYLDVSRESLGVPVYVSKPLGDLVVVYWVCRSCVVTFCGYETRVDLLLLDMVDFEVILGMDWLSPYHAILDCYAKTVTLAMPEFPRLEWRGSSVGTSSRVISFLKARHMVEKGCLAYLAFVRDTTADTPVLDSVPVVQEFFDVFPADLPGMPPDWDIDFGIYLVLGTQPISTFPFRMAPKELRDLNEQL
ncbi:uncharacterized protein [Nicotiana tomentosiformis]|uniref:uncharacterized protein n=1 Tax=Nicotiana tomentosiformis TaxID=4098 RepID=UPI00388C51C8